MQWANPGVKPAIKSSDRPVQHRPRARAATGRSDCSHRVTGRLLPCKACYSMCACLCVYRSINRCTRVCSLRPCYVARVSATATLPLVEEGNVNTLLSHVGKGQPPLDAPQTITRLAIVAIYSNIGALYIHVEGKETGRRPPTTVRQHGRGRQEVPQWCRRANSPVCMRAAAAGAPRGRPHVWLPRLTRRSRGGCAAAP